MTTRYCIHCDAEVEDTGGFCLLGHLLRSAPLTPTIGELRGDPGPDSMGDLEPSNPPFHGPKRDAQVVTAGAMAEERRPDGPSAGFSPSSPPEASEEHDALPAESSRYGLWDTLFSPGPSRILANDPIADFAADGRINWGPRRRFLAGRPFRRQLA